MGNLVSVTKGHEVNSMKLCCDWPYLSVTENNTVLRFIFIAAQSLSVSNDGELGAVV